MSFADYAKKKYASQGTNEQSFSSYAQNKYGTARGDASARLLAAREQLEKTRNSIVRTREREDAALEAAKAAEKEDKRLKELEKYGIPRSSKTATLSDIAGIFVRRQQNNAKPAKNNKHTESSTLTPRGKIQQAAMPSDDTQRAGVSETITPVDIESLLRQAVRLNGSGSRESGMQPLAEVTANAKAADEAAWSSFKTVQDKSALSGYEQAKQTYDNVTQYYARTQGPFLDENGQLITSEGIEATKRALKAQMEAAQNASRAEERKNIKSQYNRLVLQPDFRENQQDPYTKENQVTADIATDDGRFESNRYITGTATGKYFKSDDAQIIYYMTDKERSILTYLRNTQGEQAAKDYLAVVKPDVEQRVHTRTAKRMEKLTDEHPVAMSGVSALANIGNTLAGGAYTLKSAAKNLVNKDGYEMDPYDLSYLGGTARDAIRENVGSRLNEYFADKKGLQKYLGNIGRNLGVGELSSGNAPKFVYDTIMSGVVDSSLAGLMGGVAGSTAVGAALVSGSAMTDTARQVKMQGGSDERALALGTVAGALEYVTEKMGYDRLAEMITSGGKGGMRAVLSNMMSEYAEEATSEVGNYLAEWCADALEDVDLSTFRQTRQAYIDQGMSADEATRRTWTDFLLQVNEAGMGGALGGAIMGGGSQLIGRAFNAAARYEYNHAISQAAKEGDPAAKAYQFNRDRTQNQDAYGQAFDAVWNGAADGLTLEQIERAAPDILDTLTPAQKQGIYDAARNEAETHTNTSDGTAKRPEVKITQIDEDGDTRTRTVDGTQSENVQTEEIQPAREHAQFQSEATADGRAAAPEQAVERERIAHREETGNAEETRQSGAETVSERVSAENSAEIETYAAERAKTGEGGVKRSYAAQKLSRDQRKQIRILDELGKHYGVEIDVVDTIDGGKANAVYEGSNKIRVALDATDQAYVQVGTHELVHYLKRMDEQGYRVVEKLVTDELSKAEGFNLEDTILERRAEYAAQNVMIDEDAAMEEIVAEAIPSIWGNERAVRAFVSQNRSLAQKVRDFIVDFVDRLRQYAADYAIDQDRMEALALQTREQDAAGTLEEIARTFDLALESAKSRREAAQTRVDMNGQTRTETAHEQAKPGKPVQKQMEAAQKRTANKQTEAAQAVETPATETRPESEAEAQKRIEFERDRARNAVQSLQTSLLHREHDAENKLQYARSEVEFTKKQITFWETHIREHGSGPNTEDMLRVLRGKLPSRQAELERLTADTAAKLEQARAELAKAREDAATWGLTPEQIRQAALAGVDAYRELMQGGDESLRLKVARIVTAAQNEIRSQIEQTTSGQTEAAQHIELTDGVKYSIRSFGEQIQDVIDGKFPENDHVYVMETPEVLQSIGLKKLPMLMTQKHAYTTTMAEGKYRSTDVNYHALGLETMQKLPNAIADPLMVIKSHNYDGRITVITELTDSKNRSVIVPIIVDGHGRWSNVDIASNVIASAYGRQKIWNDAKEALKSGEVLYVDKKRSDLIAHSLEVQYDDEVSNDRSSADIIADLTRAVKGENSENQQKISESGEENTNQAQNTGEMEAVESANGNDGAQADNAADGVRFSLKNESKNAVDVEQTLRAGDNSAETQTENTDADAHTPIAVSDSMRRWAQRRAAQAVKEYSSTIDGESVKADMEKLVSELAQNGASSDALNATVNMAKSIIEKSQRLDNTMRNQYKDLRKAMRETSITLNDTQKQEAANITGSYGRYRQSLFGSVRLVAENGIPLDSVWQEWSAQYPELFTPDLNDADMVMRLAEIKTMLEPRYINEYGEHLDAAAADLGMTLYSEALKLVGDEKRAQQAAQSVADMRSRYAAASKDTSKKVKDNQVARFQQIANDLQAARQAGDRGRQDALMKTYRANMKRAGMQQIEAESRMAYRAQFEDAAAWRKAHERTIKYANGLRQELTKPTKQKHVPMGLEKPILDVLNHIDISTTGKETQGSRQWKQSLESITKWLDEQARLQTNALDEEQTASEGHEGVWMALCGRNIQDLRAAIDTVKGANGKISQMSLAEMNALSNAMSIINHSVNSINETWTLSRRETMNELGDRSVSEMQEKRANRAQNSKIPLMRELDTLLNVDQLDAVSFFERLGDVGGTVAESLVNGQSKAYERIREASEAADSIFALDGKSERERRETIRGWRSETHTFELSHGAETGSVTMSGTQLMELYALSRREQARKHILSGGIRIAGQDGRVGDVHNYQVTQNQLENMVNTLTDEQKRVVERMQAYLSGDVAAWGNAVTEEMYLYKAFNEKNYWPIRSDSDYKRTKEQDGSVMYNALLNASWTKALVDKPSNPVTIGDALETFSGHVSDMASYSGLAMPLDDLLKWYNYQSRDENGRADYNSAVKKEIRRTIGSVGTQYIQRLVDDLNGMSRKAYESNFVGKMLSNYKRAAIMAKIRVVIQQPTAVIRASAMIDPKYFSGIRRGVGKNTIAEMQEHSGLAWWKSNGNYEIGTGASMKSMIIGMQDSTYETVSEKLGAPAGMADDFGWAIIWQAAKQETEALHPQLEAGSDEYWSTVRDRFEDVCIRTQVVDTVLTRSQLMRSKSQLMKSTTAFMSEPTKNYNLVRNALSSVYNARTPEARKAAVRTLARSTAAIAAAQMLNAVMTAGYDMLKYYDPDDDDDGDRLEMFADNWISDMADGLNPLTNIPLIKDVYAIMTGEDVERMDLSAISATVSAVEKAQSYISGNTRGLTWYGAFKPLVQALGNLVGAPASGLIADAELIANIVSPGIARTTQRESNTNTAYDMIYKAIASGDAKKAEQLRAKLKSGAFGKTPKSDKEIDAGVRDVLAIQDDRIRQCFELKRSGTDTKRLVALEKEIAADGFTMEQVVGAVNRYAQVAGQTVKENYKAAYLLGDEKKTAQYAEQAKSLGYEDEDIAAWVADKDLDEQLSSEAYTREDMMSYIRNGTDGDIRDVVDYRISVSSAEDPEKAVSSAIASEFKDEYVELYGGGKKADAENLKKRLMTAGVSEKTIDGWVYTDDDLAAWLIDGKGTQKDAQDVLDYKVRYSSAKEPESSAMNALKSYRDEYIELARSDKNKAKAMAKRLTDLGLSAELIDTWDEAAQNSGE